MKYSAVLLLLAACGSAINESKDITPLSLTTLQRYKVCEHNQKPKKCQPKVEEISPCNSPEIQTKLYKLPSGEYAILVDGEYAVLSDGFYEIDWCNILIKDNGTTLVNGVA